MRNGHSLAFVLVTIFIDSVGFGLIMPVLPRLLMEVGQIELAETIGIGAWMGLAMAVAGFLAAPVLGNLSDAWGRRPVLLIALGGLAIDYLLLALASSLWLIFVGRVLSGLFGGSYGTAQAAIADMTPPDRRARSFGLVSAAFGVGFVIGPALGGLLAQFGPRAPFLAACGLALANFIYGLTVFPETLPRERRRPFTAARANPLGAWRVLRANPAMARAAVVLLFWQIASMVYPMTWSFWALARLNWSEAMIGISFAAVGVVIALSQTLLTGRLVARLGERDAATLGLVGAVMGFVGYALTVSTWMAFAMMAFIALQSLVQPSLMAILSRRAAPEAQGEVQGITAMIMGLGSIIAPIVLTAPLSYFAGNDAPVFFPGAAFAIAAGFGVVALVLLRRLPRVVVSA